MDIVLVIKIEVHFTGCVQSVTAVCWHTVRLMILINSTGGFLSLISFIFFPGFHQGSKFYENELKREQQVNQRIEKMMLQKEQITEQQLKKAQAQVRCVKSPG